MGERPRIFITIHKGLIDSVSLVGISDAQVFEISFDGGAGEDRLVYKDSEQAPGENHPLGAQGFEAHCSELLYQAADVLNGGQQAVVEFCARKFAPTLVKSSHENVEELTHAMAICPFCGAQNVVTVGDAGLEIGDVCPDYVDFEPAVKGKGVWKFRRQRPSEPGPEPNNYGGPWVGSRPDDMTVSFPLEEGKP